MELLTIRNPKTQSILLEWFAMHALYPDAQMVLIKRNGTHIKLPNPFMNLDQNNDRNPEPSSDR